jgi:hypothetical protein
MGGNAMIHRSEIGLVLFRNLRMLLLCRSRWNMFLTREGLLLRCGFRSNSIRTSVETGMRIIDDRRVVDDRRIHIGRPNHGRVH